MADVVGLDGKPKTIEHGLAPVPSVIERLEGLLLEARRGDIRAMAVALVRVGNTTSTLFEVGDEPVSNELMAGICYLQHRYASHKVGSSVVAV